MTWNAIKIKELRKKYGETQCEFCQRLGVVVGALRYWEQDQGLPSGPVHILLDRLEEDLNKNEVRPLPGRMLQEVS